MLGSLLEAGNTLVGKVMSQVVEDHFVCRVSNGRSIKIKESLVMCHPKFSIIHNLLTS